MMTGNAERLFPPRRPRLRCSVARHPLGQRRVEGKSGKKGGGEEEKNRQFL